MCPTYNRAPYHLHLLNESVYWFLRQDYPGPRELVILNDCVDQTLACDAPDVRVVNWHERIPTLGEKRNRLAELSEGDVLLPWDDDDVSLPHRVRQAVDRLGEYEYWNPRQTWYEERGRLIRDHHHQVCHNASAYRRGALRYEAVSGPEDALADAWAASHLRVSPHGLAAPREWSYVYRWGVSDCHISGTSDMQASYDRPRKIVSGTYTIRPTMYRDYANEAAIGAG
ncbi:hypothetical protein FRUB_07244 [Fimbriiglobus ruber]|uniref:Glycosyltransferase 2-like domain-containing protein n=1 Tax=Fimbriiglobus ruber TaxID=1908690 RepID=A0A225DEP5_9BACT|nr:hypothetical protein FRUB_07244 [Fimbriiglobus ruber]